MKQSFMFFIFMLGLLPAISQAETGVSRAIFTTAIDNLEPVSDLQQVATDTTRVYFFTELNGLSGHAITHRWEYNGKVMAEVSFQVKANRWRTWSSKNLLAGWAGTWLVSVVDEGGNLIEQSEFEYVRPESGAGTETP